MATHRALVVSGCNWQVVVVERWALEVCMCHWQVAALEVRGCHRQRQLSGKLRRSVCHRWALEVDGFHWCVMVRTRGRLASATGVEGERRALEVGACVLIAVRRECVFDAIQLKKKKHTYAILMYAFQLVHLV